MKKLATLTALAFAHTLAFAAGAVQAQPVAHDEVAASFGRLLAHEAAPPAAVVRAAAADPLLNHLVAALAHAPAEPATGKPALAHAERTLAAFAAFTDDTLAASFDRMLGHEPAATATVANEVEHDPLTKQLNAALWERP